MKNRILIAIVGLSFAAAIIMPVLFAATVTNGDAKASTSNGNSYPSNTGFTVAVNDLLVVFVATAGCVDAGTNVTDTQNLGFTLVGSATYATATGTLYCFVANKLATATTDTVTFNNPNDPATGAVTFIARIAGVSRTGLSAILQHKEQSDIAVASTPNPAFTNSVNTANPTLGCVAHGATPAPAWTPPASWTELSDIGFNNPTVNAEYVSRDSGFTGTQITWGNGCITATGAAVIVEVDASEAPTTQNSGFFQLLTR